MWKRKNLRDGGKEFCLCFLIRFYNTNTFFSSVIQSPHCWYIWVFYNSCLRIYVFVSKKKGKSHRIAQKLRLWLFILKTKNSFCSLKDESFFTYYLLSIVYSLAYSRSWSRHFRPANSWIEYKILVRFQDIIIDVAFKVLNKERVVDRLPLMTYGLKLRLEAWILKFKNFNLSFKEII